MASLCRNTKKSPIKMAILIRAQVGKETCVLKNGLAWLEKRLLTNSTFFLSSESHAPRCGRFTVYGTYCR